VSARCAEWPRLEALIARRLERADDSAALLSSSALAHVEACPECRGLALRFDPTIALQPLAAADPVDPSAALDEAAEVEAMLQAVETLRRAHPGRGRAAGGPTWRVAAAVLLAAGALYQLPARGPRVAEKPTVETLFENLGTLPSDAELVRAAFAVQPVVEDLDRPDARVYQLGGGDVSVVMIVDETLDV